VRPLSLPFFLQRARAGTADAADDRALALVRAELPRVERLLGRLLGPRADLEDLVQNVFLEACRAFPRYRGDGSPGAFVGGVAVRVARRAMRGTAFSRRRADLLEEPVSGGESPEEAYATRQRLACLRGALERLAPKKRVAFTLWALEGLEPREIAELTGASLAATRSQIFYAQKELKQMATRDAALRELFEAGGR
jgi:RNA polymerase sigma-70 factor (ECF subfamily)